MIEQEFEKKVLLTKVQYETLLNNFNGKSIKKITQINYYYDTENYALLNRNETLRVRQIEDHLELQFKHNKKIQNGVRISKELCKGVKCLPKIISINGVLTNYIGLLLTDRTSIEFDAYTIFLDKNYYMGKVDYEMEGETTNISDMPKELFGITFDIDSSGKYTRFTDDLFRQRDCYEISR